MGQNLKPAKAHKSPLRNCLWSLVVNWDAGFDGVWETMQVIYRWGAVGGLLIPVASWPLWMGYLEALVSHQAGALLPAALLSRGLSTYSSGLFSLYFWKGPCPSFPHQSPSHTVCLLQRHLVSRTLSERLDPQVYVCQSQLSTGQGHTWGAGRK